MDNKLFLEIRDEDFDPQQKLHDANSYSMRIAARGIVKNGDKVALLHVTRLNYHKLPGGGVESGETNEQAFMREIIEEVGCKCEIDKYLGKIVEYRGLFRITQTSHIYTSHIVGEIGNTNFMADELAEGFELIWVYPSTARELICKDNSSDYEAKFIKRRDLYILDYYLQNILSHSLNNKIHISTR